MKSLYKSLLSLGIMLTLLLTAYTGAKAQLNVGDIIFTGYNGIPSAGAAPDTFTFVALAAIPSSTTIYFTERGYQNSAGAWQASGSSEGTISLQTTAALAIGDEVVVRGFTATRNGSSIGTVAAVAGSGNATTGLSLSNAGDQVIAFQGGSGDPTGASGTVTCIAGITWALQTCGTTTDATWQGSGCGAYGPQTSAMPPGLTGGTNAFMVGTPGATINNDHARFNAVTAGAPFSTVAALRTAIMTKSNWDMGGATNATIYPLAPGYTYYSTCTPPAITGQPSNATICPAANTSFTITASNATGYQWQVNTGSGFGNITNGGVYSNATTATLNITGATAGMNGYTYRCIASGACAPDATSNAATLTLTAAPSITVQPSGVTLCEGNTSFSVTASNATGYQWQVSTGGAYSNVTNTGVYTGATTSTLTLTGAVGTMNGYNYQVIVSNGCPTTTTSTPAATLTISPDTWVGGTNTNWNTAANWSCGVVPAATTNVVIPSGTTFSPLVNITTATCNNITINSGATLSFSAGSNVLDVKANFTNSGTFDASLGKLKLSGTSTQTVPGATYKDFELAGTGVKTASGAITINGVMTLTNGFLQLGTNNLTMGSSSSFAGANAVLLNPSPTSFIITNISNSTSGQLKIQNIGTGGKTGAVLFPIGTSSSSYTPVTIQNAGTADEFGARVRNGVYKSYDASGNNTGPVQNTYNVGKTWLLAETTAGGSNATVNFAWSSFDEQPGFNDGACFASHYENGGWHTVLPAQTANGFDPYSLAMNNITSFSPFAIGSQFSILPLNLLSFTGKATQNGTALSWVTANEKNVAGFDVERATNGSDYQRIGNVPARANNSTTETNYSYADTKTPAGTIYYRLKMVDIDGTFNYSNTVVVNTDNSNAHSFTVYPNPADGNNLNIQLSSAAVSEITVQITDVTGRVWYTGAMKAGEVIMPVSIKTLPAGIYNVNLNGSTVNGTTRFTKL